MHDWNWISFASGVGSGIILLIWMIGLCEKIKRNQEAKRLAEQNDAAIRCRHGVKKWKVCIPCAEDFAHLKPCEGCGFEVDDRFPMQHFCHGRSGFSGYQGSPRPCHHGVHGFHTGPCSMNGDSGFRGLTGPCSMSGLSGFRGLSGYSGFSGYGVQKEIVVHHRVDEGLLREALGVAAKKANE